MAVRQYIGARYVPLLDGDYNPNKAYEPLTTVNFGTASYTSKKSVPAGIDPTHAEYWQQTGFGSQGVAELEAWKDQTVTPFMQQTESDVSGLQSDVSGLQSDVSTLQGDVSTLHVNVTNINSEITQLHAKDADLQSQIDNIHVNNAERYYIFIGDSYMTGATSTTPIENTFVNIFKQSMGLDESHLKVSCVNGAGFVAGTTFLQQLTTLVGDLTQAEKDLVTDVVVLGGWNDRNATDAEIVNNANDFCLYCNNNLKNAKIHIGMISYCASGTYLADRTYLLKVKGRYNTSGVNYKVSYIKNIDVALGCAKGYMESDGAKNHPSEYGHFCIARNLISYFNGGGVFDSTPTIRNEAQFTPSSGVTFTGTGNISERKSNGVYTLDFSGEAQSITFTGSNVPQPTVPFKLGTLVNNIGHGLGRFTSGWVTGFVKKNTTTPTFYPLSGVLYLEGDGLYWVHQTVTQNGYFNFATGDSIQIWDLQIKCSVEYS